MLKRHAYVLGGPATLVGQSADLAAALGPRPAPGAEALRTAAGNVAAAGLLFGRLNGPCGSATKSRTGR